MSSQTKIKKDKEIIAEYETQVKGLYACLLMNRSEEFAWTSFHLACREMFI